jgi:hypothetical protein
MHRKVRAVKITGTGGTNKMVVQGARNRDSNRVEAQVIMGTDAETVQANIYDWLESGSALFTDKHRGYNGLEQVFAHKMAQPLCWRVCLGRCPH